MQKRTMSIKVSAPGKLLLLGDHSVVYGYPCLVTAVDKRLYVEAEVIESDNDDIITPQVKESRFVLESIAYFKEQFQIKESVRIKTKGDFSHQVGLGSSSAVTVATFKALSLLFNKQMNLRELFQMSYHVNLLIQGVGSGFDIAAATYGETLEYVVGGKVIEPLHIKSLPLVVGYSGIKADTPFYIRRVAEAFKSKKEEMESIFNSMKTLVERAKKGLLSNDLTQVGQAMNKNQELLVKLGVSTPKLDDMVSSAVSAGAYGAKLSGAGGGDCMIALIDETKRLEIETAIEKVGGEIIHVNVNTTGVTVES
ncbi:mevalonate kinase [Candidatus Roizmanbacteria bacterium CG_4_10_14_0_8_um_filter_39_9]|uniref:Mevalonate kinase n=1 Tax=Candidatus Roizmanbacteria bacterium CG_4_10_14_0_8_um_filter_39_9 TaxID=1974829 RepID=A0A2M7QF89_9BACT|nr:MAG: mevalonate kinase [Candidatus Roizmanbacteria bacterium CG_4_10_14_0_8_um_filter_39_9]